jgi:hypothetical protein
MAGEGPRASLTLESTNRPTTRSALDQPSRPALCYLTKVTQSRPSLYAHLGERARDWAL